MLATMDSHDVHRAARQVGDSGPVEYGARVGLAASGVLHLVIAWIALLIAWGRGGGTADQSGAFGQLAAQPGGSAILWVATIGFALLALWQLSESLTGAHGREAADRAKAVGKGVMYLALGWTGYRFASGGSTSSRAQTQDFTATLLAHTGGRFLVAIFGVAVIWVGGYHVYKGWTKAFVRDLRGQPGGWALTAGRAGYVAKGLALAVVGLLFLIGAWHRSSAAATGLDGALRTLRRQPFGSILLTVVALGIACYGIYSFARARYAKV